MMEFRTGYQFYEVATSLPVEEQTGIARLKFRHGEARFLEDRRQCGENGNEHGENDYPHHDLDELLTIPKHLLPHCPSSLTAVTPRSSETVTVSPSFILRV